MTGKSPKNKLVSVIVPAYNYASLLPDTLACLLSQEYPYWECLIIDDGSTDNTKQVADQWIKKDSRFRYIYQKNKGLSSARNTGIAHSKGDFIQLLDADDLIENQKFRKQLDIFEKQPATDIVYGDVRYFTTQDLDQRWYSMHNQGTLWMKKLFSEDNGKLTAALFNENIMAVNCPLIRRSVFEEIGLFNVSLKSVEDWEYWCRCLLAGKKFQYADEPGAYALVRTHGESMSRNLRQMMEASLKARNGLAAEIEKHSKFEAKAQTTAINYRQMNYLQKELFHLYSEKGLRGKAFLMLWKNYRLTGHLKHFLKEIYQFIIP